MRKATLGDRLRYAFDNTLARGPVAQIAWLGMVSLGVILLAALLVTLVRVSPEDGPPLAFHEAAWLSLMRTLDPGTMGGDVGWGFRIVMLGVTFGGIFVISTLIGVISSGIDGKLNDLRKGRTRVIESGHTVILGWSDQVFPIVAELVLANANQVRASIAILAERDKVEMEDALRERVGTNGPTRLVCRSGSPTEMADLDLVNLGAAKSIIDLSPGSESPDADVIKVLLAITNNPDRRPEPYHIVVEIRQAANLEVARMVGRDEVEVVLVGDLISRMIAQTCRQSGLSVVYSDLLDFGGDEIYFKEEPSLVGRTVGEVLPLYEDACVIGLVSAGQGPRLLPPLETPLQSGDSIIFIAEDDDTILLSAPPRLRWSTPPSAHLLRSNLGWRPPWCWGGTGGRRRSWPSSTPTFPTDHASPSSLARRALPTRSNRRQRGCGTSGWRWRSRTRPTGQSSKVCGWKPSITSSSSPMTTWEHSRPTR
jgi:hypothetical protein